MPSSYELGTKGIFVTLVGRIKESNNMTPRSLKKRTVIGWASEFCDALGLDGVRDCFVQT